ncbi:hypothetical protein GGI07_000532 [Coemansia sp. Benny D115]|nr:hypothetical protein GGI07_000532 [Coemansia sp. Benny D115]
MDKSFEFKQRADSAFRAGNHDLAAELYTKAITIDPTNPVLFTNRAQAELKLLHYHKAIASCSAALALDPRNVKALWRRGTAYGLLAQYIEAKHDLQCALQIEPSNKLIAGELERIEKLVTAGNISMEKPNNSQMFERGWRQYGTRAELLYEYLKLIAPSELPRLFRASLESRHIMEIAAASEVALSRDDAPFVASVLSILPQTDRFSLAVLFMDDKDKARVQTIAQSAHCSEQILKHYR